MAMNCRDIEDNLEGLLDGGISPLLRKEIEKHLQNCTLCQNLVKSHQQIYSKIKEKGPVSPSSNIRSNVMEKITENPLPAKSSFPGRKPSLMAILPLGMIVAGGILSWTWFSSPSSKINQGRESIQTSVGSKTVDLSHGSLASETASQSIGINKTPE